MFFKLLSKSTICNFPNYSDYRGQEVLEYFKERTKNIIMNDELKDWTLILFLSFSNVKKIMIWKRGIPLTKSKEKEMSISIPVPYQSTMTWGISEKLFTSKDHFFDEKKAFLVKPVDYSNYDNLPDFLYDNSILAINSFFEIGFTINGFKIKG